MSTFRLVMSLIAIVSATPALSQGGSPGGGSAGASGTAGVNSSASTPAPGTLGTPGPTSSAGLPGGSGTGTGVTVPNIPGVPQSRPSVGRDSAGTSGAPTAALSSSGSGSSPGSATGPQSPAAAREVAASGGVNFNPGAVTDNGLELAAKDVTAMSFVEQRDLVGFLDACTVRGHAIDRTGRCGALRNRYKSAYAKDRNIDRSLQEFDRVVRFQRMFKSVGPRDTRYEDDINNRLRTVAKTSLAASTVQREMDANRGDQNAPTVSRDVSLSRSR